MKKFLLIFFILPFANGAKILGVFPFPAHSHFTVGFTIMKELAERGHEVTMISSYPQKTPIKNYRDISVAEIETPFTQSTHCFFLFNIFNF